MAQMVKPLPAMQETWVQSLGQKDMLEEETTTHSNILSWEISWTGSPWQAIVHGVAKSQTTHSSILSWEIPWTGGPMAGYSP